MDSSKMLRSLHELEADDQPAAVQWAHDWTEDQIDVLIDSSTTEACADLYHALMRLRRIETNLSQRFVEILSDCAMASVRDAEPMTFSDDDEIAPPWLSGVTGPEGEINYRGLSVLGGETGVGKSKLATRSALLAASNPNIGVIYLCAELDAPTSALYAQQATGLAPTAVLERFPNYRPIMVPAGCSFERVVQAVLSAVPAGCTRLVIVADTLNTLVEKCLEDGNDYFRLMRQFGIWMLESRVATNGKIGWLAVSELNRDSRITGIKLEKWADFVMRFRGGDIKNQVEIDILKGRYSGQDQLGLYRLNWQTCEMEPA